MNPSGGGTGIKNLPKRPPYVPFGIDPIAQQQQYLQNANQRLQDIGKITIVAASATLAGTVTGGLVDLAAGDAWVGEMALLNCFPAGTPVSTPRGLFPIDKIKIGDEVWAFDLIRSCWTPRRVLRTFERDHDGLFRQNHCRR